MTRVRVGVVDIEMGNLFSVHLALEAAGADVAPVRDPGHLAAIDGLVLPGVGAFADAMATLADRGLAGPILQWARADKPLMGVCLGMQLLMESSEEFGTTKGLGLIPGKVVRLPESAVNGRREKIPHIGWSPVRPAPENPGAWARTVLRDLPAGAWMYFVHSYHVVPARAEAVVAVTPFGTGSFCSVLAAGRTFGCQFHPERSGPAGLGIYRAFAETLRAAARDHGAPGDVRPGRGAP